MVQKTSSITISSLLFQFLLFVSPLIRADFGKQEERWCGCPNRRPPEEERRFRSATVEKAINSVVGMIKDRELACLFANCFPNTLDTTVFLHTPGETAGSGKSGGGSGVLADTFIITGDIPAMWLRDSCNQVLPYMRFVSSDPALAQLIEGLIHRQASQVLADPYANAHNIPSLTGPSPHTSDATSNPTFGPSRTNAMVPGIFERKFELDSLCAFLKLSRSYYEATNSTAPFTENPDWAGAAVRAISVIDSMRMSSESEAAQEGGPIYQFQRAALEPTDTLLHGTGSPGAETGMARSPFRPSDDATTFPFLVPANAMAVVELRRVANLMRKAGSRDMLSLADRAEVLANEIDQGIQTYAVIKHPSTGEVYAYEVDGFGNSYFADDANVPSLLSLPYLGYVPANDTVYNRTRHGVLSRANPWYFNGTAGSGIGGPHVGLDMIWPMSIIMRALTSTDDREIAECLSILKRSSAGTGLMHESFQKDNPGTFTRPWFAWANSLFADLIFTLAEKRPHLLTGAG